MDKLYDKYKKENARLLGQEFKEYKEKIDNLICESFQDLIKKRTRMSSKQTVQKISMSSRKVSRLSQELIAEKANLKKLKAQYKAELKMEKDAKKK
jgi:vacuolar-type H+-ATPase subunit I/STV1